MRRRDYVCFCQNGYNRITDNLGNFLRCVDVDECTTGLSNCAPGVGVCTNTPGGFTCKCPKGYTGNGIFCADINECLDPALSKCDENAHCTNSLGGFSCDCVEGFISIAEEGTAFTGECKGTVDLLPYGADEGDIQLFITLHYVWQFPPFIITEVVSPPIYVDYGIPLMDGKLFHYIYIIENGLVIMSDRRIYVPTLRNPVSLSSVLRFVYADNIAVFAPFWTNNRFYNLLLGHAPKVWYQVYTEQSHFVMTVVNKLVIQQFSPTFSFRAKLVLVVTYDSMVPPWTATTQEVNTVQLVIATDYAHTFVLYKYPRGRMKWTPVFSTNQAQFYSFPARIGFVIRHTNTFGIRTEWSVEDLNSGQWSRMTGRPNAFRISDRLPTGLLAYRVETNSDTWVNPRLACQSWFEEEEDPLTWALSLVGRCPSTMAHALQEYGTFTTSPSEYRNAICFTRLFSSSSGGNMDCCYELFTGALLGGNRVNSGAGFLRRYERTSNQYYTREYLPYQWCTMQARSTAYVDRYVSRRIMSSSSSYRMVIQGTGFGDPHLATADGVEFTFNGYNEYVLLRSRSSAPYRFELQGRTSQSATRNGNVKATVFTAFAFRQPNDTVEVFLSEDSSSFLVRVNGQEVPISAIVNGSRSTFGDGRMFPRYANGNGQSNATGLLVSFPSGASVVINLSNNILTYTVGVAQDMQGQLEGMLGNFDGRYLGDFAFPNGTTVPLIDPRNPREEELFSFGNTWSLRALSAFDGTSVDDLSLFTYYPQGTSPMTYGDDSFRPTFFGDDLSVLFGDASLQEQAVAVCGSVTARECLYDVAITGDLSFGNDTMNHEKAFKDACGILMNSPPELEYPEEIVAYVNQEYNVTLNATDDKDKTVTFTLTGNGTMARTGNLTASFSWLPTSAEKAFVEFIVTDSTGAASSITPKITICGCQNNGTCEFDRIISRDNGFAMAPCTCVPGFAGDMCEQDADGCADIPCFQGVTCTDVKGAINITAGKKGYTCGPCPDDTTGDGETCEDVDECLLDAGDPRCHKCVNANCINTPGSYTCVCKEGFHKDGDDKVCYDIDECRSDNTNDCDWVFGYCNNTEGGYECLCDPGFISYDGGLTCEDLNECLINNGGCQRICKNNEGSYECDCGVAYYLTSDEHTCIELDECETNTKCEYYCEDFVGHYECYCPDLFSADENGRTCSPYVNCSSNNTCHPEPIGACAQNWTTDEDTCFCVRGYELQLDNSCRDIDECTNGEARCDENSIGCNNTPGDYECICKDGYELSVSHGLRKCHNINECNDNYGNCSHECEDTVGSFYCDCPKGWRLGSDQRTCEDINECSSDALNDCSYNAVCNNTIGGYLCQCQDGFSGDGSLCGDIDECIQLGERGQGGCEVGCTNFNGGYVCTCGTGYQLRNDSVSCEDIDECSVPGTCEQVCNNTLGSYFCSCSGDNVLREDGSTCRLNTNLCNYGCHEKAKYIKENSTCVCRSGYTGNGTNCDIADPGVVVEVTLDNLEYTEGLGDCTSVAFIKLKGDVESALSFHFTGHQNFTVRENFLSFILSSFSNGSVVANLTLATKNLMSDQDIQKAMTNVRALSIGNLNVFTELCYPGHCLYGGSCSVTGAQRQCSCTIGRGGSRCEYLLSATTAGIVVAILVVVAPLLLVAACVLRRKNIEETAKLYRGSRSHSHIWWNMTRPRFKASFPNVPMQGAGWVTLRKRHGLGTYVEAFPYVDLDVRRYFPSNRRYSALSEGSVSTWRSSGASSGTTQTGDSTWVAEWDDYMKVFGGDSEFRFPRNIVCDITPLIEDDDNLSVQSYQTGLTGHMDLKSEGSSLSESLTSLATSGVGSVDSSCKKMEPTVQDEWSNWKIKPPSLPSGAGHKWAVWSTSPNNSQGAPHEGTQRSSDDARTQTESGKGSSDNSSLFGWTLLPQTVPYAPFRTYTSGSSASSRRSSLFGWTIMPQVAPKMPLGFAEEEEGWFAWPVRQHEKETDTSSSRNPSDENLGTSSDRVEAIDSYPQSSTSDGFVPIAPPMRGSDTSESDMSPWSDALLDEQSESDTLTVNSAENKDGGSDQDLEEPSKTSPPTSFMSDGFIPLVQSSSSSTDFLTGTDDGSASEESGTPPRSDTHSDDIGGNSTTNGFKPIAPLKEEESKYEESGFRSPSDTHSDDTVGSSTTSGFTPLAPSKDEEKESDESGMPVLSDDRSADSVSRTESDLLTSIMEDVEAVRTELREVMSSDSDGSRKITREKFTRL